MKAGIIVVALSTILIGGPAKTDDFKVLPASITTDRQEIWISALEWCESKGLPEAINPKDLDGTPSNGILQFKVRTFADLSKKYNVSGKLMDPEAQREIVRHMINDQATNWEKQFPDCVHRLGRPPR